jgi:hypothetical protein
VKIKMWKVLCGLSVCYAANASQLFTNGGFEAGSLAGWTVTNNAAAVSNGDSFFIDNTNTTPETGHPTVGAAGGSYYAVSDGFGSGLMILSQTFVDPLGTTSAILSFKAFVNDFLGSSGSAGSVQLVAGGVGGTLVATFFGPADTLAAGGVPNGWTAFSADIAADMTPGSTYTIRIVDNETSGGGPINVGADAFSLIATGSAIPEPAMFLPVGLMAGFFLYRNRKAQVRS